MTAGRPPAGAGDTSQLALGLEPGGGTLLDRVRPMVPTDGDAPFDDPDYLFEPWWPGVRAFVSVEGGRVRLRAESLGDPAPRFPELAALPLLVREDGSVLDATLMVLDADGRPSTALLEARLSAGGHGSGSVHGPGSGHGTGGAQVSAGTAAVVVSDLLWRGGRDLSARTFRERRAALDEVLDPAPWCMAAHGFVGQGTHVASVLAPLGFTALSARRLDARVRRGRAGDAWFRVPLVPAPRALPPVFAVIERLPL